MRDNRLKQMEDRRWWLTRRAALRVALRGSVAAAGLLAAATPRMAGAASGDSLVPRTPPPPVRFDVIRAGSVIGRHDVNFVPADSGYNVRTLIDITVRMLGIKVFEYHHDGTETWRAGRLRAFESQTQDDDSDFFVNGHATDDGFRITNRKDTVMAPADIMVGSYWTPEIARRPLLIDPQRGRLKDQTLLGTDSLSVDVDGKAVSAIRYRLIGVTDGWVAYDDRGRWLAAELKKKGSDIFYRLRP